MGKYFITKYLGRTLNNTCKTIMKKNLLKTTLLSTLFLGAVQFNQTFAQFDIENLSFGAGIGTNSYAQGIGGSLAFNLRGHYMVSEKVAFTLGYNTQIPIKNTYEYTANAYSSTTNPSSIDVNGEESISFHNIAADLHYYFVSDMEESFGLYGLVGLGLTFAGTETEFENYDKANYGFGTTTYGEAQTYTGFIINAGIGANFMISDQVSIFGEGRIGLPANKQDDQLIVNPIPFSYGLLAGVRFCPFN